MYHNTYWSFSPVFLNSLWLSVKTTFVKIKTWWQVDVLQPKLSMKSSFPGPFTLISIIYREHSSDMDTFSLSETKSHLCYVNCSQDKLISALVFGCGNKTEELILEDRRCSLWRSRGSEAGSLVSPLTFPWRRTVSQHTSSELMIHPLRRKVPFLHSLRAQVPI